jgi:aminoglycoside 6-adenylyltransferase
VEHEKPYTDPIESLVTDWARNEPTVPRGGARHGHSDYDVVLFLEPQSRLGSTERWLEKFGRPLIVLRDEVYHRDEPVPTRLVQYRGGNRIDFTLSRIDLLHRIAEQDNLPDWLAAGYRVLLDRDGDAGRLSPPSASAYVPRPPTAREYSSLVDEFWWETYYVGKYLARNELLPARYSMETVLRYRCLVPMLEWYVQVGRSWEQSVGARGRGLRWLLEPEDRERLDATYAGSLLAEHRKAILAMTALFRRSARAVGRDLGYEYPEALDREMEQLLRSAANR